MKKLFKLIEMIINTISFKLYGGKSASPDETTWR